MLQKEGAIGTIQLSQERRVSESAKRGPSTIARECAVRKLLVTVERY